MTYLKTAVVFTCLLAGHLLLAPWLMMGIYCLLGIWLAVGKGQLHRPLLTVILCELALGILFWLFDWKLQLSVLADNMHVTPFALAGITIAVNLITAFLVTGSCYYGTRLVRHFARKRTIVVVEKEMKIKPGVVVHN